MPKIIHNQSNFTAGELSPRMRARGDVQRYQNGAEIIENGVVAVHGGVMRRAGLRYLATTKHAGAHKSRLIRFVLNVEQSYMLEFGQNYIRLFDGYTGAVILNDALAVLEIATPYTEDQLAEITTKQAVDVMYLFHPDVPPQMLRRLTPTRWVLYPIPFGVLPFSEAGHQPGTVLSLSAATVGAGRTFTTTPVGPPGAPVIGTAYALNGAAAVNFTAPANTGGLPIESYTVTSSPGGITATGTSSPIRVNGLTNGTAYTFTVTATQGAGTSPASAASNSVTPSASAPIGSLSVTASPTNFSARVADGLVLSIDGPTASATGGVGALTFAWSQISGGAGMWIKVADQAQIAVDSEAYGAPNYGTFRCTVTDEIGQSGTVDVSMTVRHGMSRYETRFDQGGS